MLTFVRLNDAQVLWAYCMLNAVGRYNRFPFDFDSKGEVRMDRMPMSPAPIVWWKGQPWTPVFKGIYVLCGRWQLSAGYQVGGNIRNAASEIHVRIMHATPSAVREACKHIISVDDRSTPRPSLLDLGRMAVVVPELTANAFNIRDDGKIGAGKVMDMLIDSSCSHNPSGGETSARERLGKAACALQLVALHIHFPTPNIDRILEYIIGTDVVNKFDRKNIAVLVQWAHAEPTTVR